MVAQRHANVKRSSSLVEDLNSNDQPPVDNLQTTVESITVQSPIASNIPCPALDSYHSQLYGEKPSFLSFRGGTIERDLNSEWQGFEGPDMLGFFNATMCFLSVESNRYHVEMTSLGIPQEPILDSSLSRSTHNTTYLQDFFGLSRKRVSDRGILAMNILGDPDEGDVSSQGNAIIPIGNGSRQLDMLDDLDDNTTFGTFTNYVFEHALQKSLDLDINSTFTTCIGCGHQKYASLELSMVLGDIMNNSNRASDVLQTLITIVAGTVYEDFAKSLKYSQDAEMSIITTALAPGPCSAHQCYGYISVITLSCAHLVCCVAIAFLYASQVRHSRYANIWHAVSQLFSEETHEILKEGNNASDKTIKEVICRETHDYFVKLETCERSGRAEMAKCTCNKRGPAADI